MNGITVALVVSTVILVLTNVVTAVRNKDWDTVLKVVLAWGIGVFAIWLAGQTRWAEGATFEGVALKSLSFADLVVLGLFASGVAGTTHNLLSAIDNHKTYKTNSLVGNHQGTSAPPPMG